MEVCSYGWKVAQMRNVALLECSFIVPYIPYRVEKWWCRDMRDKADMRHWVLFKHAITHASLACICVWIFTTFYSMIVNDVVLFLHGNVNGLGDWY